MPRAGWIYVGVNMMDDDHRRLERLAEMWGLSKAAAVRRLLKEATPEMNPRHGHTCNEGQYAKWSTSNPNMKERCTVCWPTMPTTAEREAAEEAVKAQHHWCLLDGRAFAEFGPKLAPWWWHVAQAREDAEVNA